MRYSRTRFAAISLLLGRVPCRTPPETGCFKNQFASKAIAVCESSVRAGTLAVHIRQRVAQRLCRSMLDSVADPVDSIPVPFPTSHPTRNLLCQINNGVYRAGFSTSQSAYEKVGSPDPKRFFSRVVTDGILHCRLAPARTLYTTSARERCCLCM